MEASSATDWENENMPESETQDPPELGLAERLSWQDLLGKPGVTAYVEAVVLEGQVNLDDHLRICEEVDLEPEETSLLLDYLEQQGVKIIDPESDTFSTKKTKGFTFPTGEYTTDGMQAYLNEAGRRDLLTKAREVELAKLKDDYVKKYRATRAELEDLPPGETEETLFLKRIENLPETQKQQAIRGRQAFMLFMESNLRLVVSIAKNYQYSGMSLLDLVQEGNVGLVRAVEKFDWRKGYKFSTYATWWIRQAVTRGAADKARTIRLPVHIVEKLNKVKKAESRLFRDLEHQPSPEEIAEDLKMPVKEVKEMLRLADHPVSLHKPVGDSEEAEFGDFIEDESVRPPDEEAESAIRSQYIAEAVEGLPERERKVLQLRYALTVDEPWTLQQVGDELGITRERVRQIETQAINRLQTDETLKGFAKD